MMGARPLLAGVASLAIFLLPCPAAHAEDSVSHPIRRVEDPEENRGDGNGVYGRFDGDTSLRIGLGGEAAFEGPSLRPLLLLGLSSYQSLGIYASFRKGLVQADPTLSLLSFGGSISPLFLLRFRENAATGRAVWDLSLDSIALTLGAHLDHPRGEAFASTAGFEGGLEMGAPLSGQAGGPWVRARANLLTGDRGPEATVWLYFSWEAFFHVGLLPVD